MMRSLELRWGQLPTAMFGLMLLACLVTACGGPDDEARNENGSVGQRTSIVVTSPSLYWLVANLTADWKSGAPDIARLYPAASSGDSDWFPDGSQLASLQSARLVIINGSGAESWLPMVTFSEDALVNTATAVEDRLIPKPGSLVHQHGPRGSTTQRSWLAGQWHDPEILQIQAQLVAKRLARDWPAERSAIEFAQRRIDDELRSLKEECQTVADQLGDHVVADPSFVFAYLVRACGLKTLSSPLPSRANGSDSEKPPNAETAPQSRQPTLTLADNEALSDQGSAANLIVLDPIRSDGDNDFMARFRSNLEALAGVRAQVGSHGDATTGID